MGWVGPTLLPRRTPAVSRKTYSLPFRLIVWSMTSRVVPATELTMARSTPVSLLRSDDLPTFGLPW